MAYNLDYTIHIAEKSEGQSTEPAKKFDARVSLYGDDLNAAKLEAEQVIAQAGGTTGEIREGTSTTFVSGALVASFDAKSGWTEGE